MKQLFLFFGESISSLEVRPQGVPTFQQSFQLEGKKRGMGALGNRSRPHRQMTVRFGVIHFLQVVIAKESSHIPQTS